MNLGHFLYSKFKSGAGFSMLFTSWVFPCFLLQMFWLFRGSRRDAVYDKEQTHTDNGT